MAQAAVVAGQPFERLSMGKAAAAAAAVAASLPPSLAPLLILPRP